MDELDKLLRKADVSHSERVVYLAGLGKSMRTADFVREIKLPRSTITNALSGLQDCGLCQAEPLDEKSFVYTMQPVERLNTYLSQKATKLSTLMDEITEFQTPTDQLNSKTAQGQADVQALLELALHCKSRKWQIIATRDNPIKFMPNDYISYFKKTREDRQIESLSLWDETGKRSLGLHDLLMRKPRYIPKDITGKIPGLLLAFDSSLLLIEGTNNPRAVLIENKAIADTFVIIFEMAWRFVKP